MRLES